MTTETQHKHRWRIETPEGRYSLGRCACGAVRQFRNSEEEWRLGERSEVITRRLSPEEKLYNDYLRGLRRVDKSW